MSANGAFSLVLHGHLPFRSFDDGRLHEFTSSTLIPLLQALYNLKDDRVPYALTISLSPLLIEQLSRPEVPSAFNVFVDAQIAAARHDSDFFKHQRLVTGNPDHVNSDPHLAYLAETYIAHFEAIKAAFNQRFAQDVVGAFRQLQDAGQIELIASPATHAYLPLLEHDSVVRQVHLGIAYYQQVFGRQPTGMWLPELGYRPGLEAILADEGIQVFACESHTLTGGAPVGVAAGESRGISSAVINRYALVQQQNTPIRDTTTMQPYWADAQGRIATIARDNRSTMQVWGEMLGYPGDVDYREPLRQSGTSGLPYWRITGHNVGLPDKDYYRPEWARYKVEQHAEHFAHLIGDMVRGYHAETGRAGLIAPMFDMQLFGDRWFEGVQWLAQTFRHLANTPQIELTTMSQHVAEHPPTHSVQLLEGSWGTGGNHFLVDNPATRGLWTRLRQVEDRLAQIDTTNLTDRQRDTFNQAVRQLLLLQSSDWAIKITALQADTYAIHQLNVHYRHFEHLMTSLESGHTIQEGKGHGEDRSIFPIFSQLDAS